MTQMEVSEFTFTRTNNLTNYIDLTKSDTLANCKGKYQFKNGKPLAYVFSARLTDPTNKLETIPTNWISKNALVKTSAAWEKMYKKAGLRKRDLNTYGKELRLAFNDAHRDNWGKATRELVADGLPTSYRTNQYDDSGNPTFVYTTYDDTSALPAGFTQAFDHTELTVPSPEADTNATAWKPFVIGTGDGVINQYCLSRGTVDVEDEDLEASGELLDPENKLRLMLSDNEETADDVTQDHADHGDYRPYDIASMINYTTAAIPEGANVAGQDTVVCAPLGLIKWTGGTGDKLFIRLEAVIEM